MSDPDLVVRVSGPQPFYADPDSGFERNVDPNPGLDFYPKNCVFTFKKKEKKLRDPDQDAIRNQGLQNTNPKSGSKTLLVGSGFICGSPDPE